MVKCIGVWLQALSPFDSVCILIILQLQLLKKQYEKIVQKNRSYKKDSIIVIGIFSQPYISVLQKELHILPFVFHINKFITKRAIVMVINCHKTPSLFSKGIAAFDSTGFAKGVHTTQHKSAMYIMF
jgi:hypothetical protein